MFDVWLTGVNAPRYDLILLAGNKSLTTNKSFSSLRVVPN